MVKPLNKEWALFGRKYRVPGAKGEKVDCNACQKQVSAAVNRLQSHLRVCPARPLALPTPTPTANATSAIPTPTPTANGQQLGTDGHDQEHDDAAALGAGALDASADAATLPAAKRPRLHPTVAAAAPHSLSDDGAAYTTSAATNPTNSYAARRLEIEEQRLQLELARARREQTRERLELEILAAQARREALATAAQAYEARVALALARKQLRDQGVDAEEIDRLLPVEPLVLGGDAAVATETSVAPCDAVEEVEDAEEDAEEAEEEEETSAVALETASTTAVVDEDVHGDAEAAADADEAVL